MAEDPLSVPAVSFEDSREVPQMVAELTELLIDLVGDFALWIAVAREIGATGGAGLHEGNDWVVRELVGKPSVVGPHRRVEDSLANVPNGELLVELADFRVGVVQECVGRIVEVHGTVPGICDKGFE